MAAKLAPEDRKALLATLANTESQALVSAWRALEIEPEYTLLKQPEIGMVMVKAKTGGNGSPFNMGEMTVTRTVLQLHSHEMGYGYTAGRDKDKSLTIALIDACYQVEGWQEQIEEKLVQPLRKDLQQARSQHQETVDRTKVNFFTMVRGE